MLVTFTTNAYADITLFGDVALAMLKMMGHSATVPGAILAEDVPAALSRLTAASANMTAVSSPLYSKLNFTSGCDGANGALLACASNVATTRSSRRHGLE